MTQTVRQTAIAKQDEAIASNVAKIEQAKRPNALQIMAGRLNIDPNALRKTLAATVFKDANDDQFAALVIVANEYKLNPLTKEIYAFPQKGGGIVPMVSIDGWVRITNEHPAYDGIEFTDIADANGKLMAIEAIIYRSDRSRPTRVVEYLDECRRESEPWKKSPARMLRHRAYMQCARYAFGFSGIYADDEIVGDVQLGGDITPQAPIPARRAAITAPAELDEDAARQLDETFDPRTGEVLPVQEELGREPATDHTATVDGWHPRLSKAVVMQEVAKVESEFQAIRKELDTGVADIVEGWIADAKARLGGGLV